MDKELIISREEYVACALIDYLEAKPKHINGLCYYLGYTNAAIPGDREYGRPYIEAHAADLVQTAREVLPQFGRTAYVDSTMGPTRIRRNLAKEMLKLLTSGRLYYQDYRGWLLRPNTSLTIPKEPS